MIRVQHIVTSFLAILLIAAFALFATSNAAVAVPGAETREDAFAELAERQAAGEELSEEELEGLVAARAAEAVTAITAEGVAPLQAIGIYLFEAAGEDTDEPRTTATLVGFIDPYTPLPVQVMFHFTDGFSLQTLEELDFDTRESLGELEYASGPSDLEDFENLTTYAFTLTEGHVFNAGFEIPLPLFGHDAMMGEDAALATFSFVPPNDLYGLEVGFISPSPDLVGAGGQEERVVLLFETEDGEEVYGIIRENVPGGELQDYIIAFASRASRDAALAGADSEDGGSGVLDWLTSPEGMIITGAVVVAIVAAGLIIVVVSRQKNAGDAGDIDDEGDDDYDDEGDDVDGDDSDDGYDDEEAAATS